MRCATEELWLVRRHPAAAAAASLLAAVLPASVSQVVEPARPLLTLRLPGQQRLPCICAVQPPAGAAAGGYGQPPGEEPQPGSSRCVKVIRWVRKGYAMGVSALDAQYCFTACFQPAQTCLP